MTTLAANKKRDFELNEDPLYNDVPAVASDVVYEGAAVGDNGSGYGRPLVAADPFMGFAAAKCDNASGSAGDKSVRVRQRGTVKLTVTGVTGVGDVGDDVYASDDDTFTKTSSGNSAIGTIVRWISSTTCMVRFEAAQVRSI